MLTAISPSRVVTSANTPGRSGTGTRSSAVFSLDGAPAGRLTRASRARSSMSSIWALSPVATIWRTSPRATRSRSSTSRMPARLSTQRSGQMAGSPAATRVMSRNPPAARRNRVACSRAVSAARFMRVAAVRCGTWETSATRSSWRAAGNSTTLAPRVLTTDRTVANAPASVLAAGVRTHVAPSNMSGSDPSTPSCSEPAMGCPPTNRG